MEYKYFIPLQMLGQVGREDCLNFIINFLEEEYNLDSTKDRKTFIDDNGNQQWKYCDLHGKEWAGAVAKASEEQIGASKLIKDLKSKLKNLNPQD